MRIHNRGGWIQTAAWSHTRTIVGGLVVLLMVAVAGCADAEPKSTGVPRVPTSAQVATPTPSVTAPPSPAPADATDVEVVYASPAYPLPWDQGEYDPLWGDLDTDAPIIDRLLRAIAGGTPVEIVEIDEERTWTPYSSLIMNLRFRNGTTWSVRTAIRCDITSEGRKTKCLPVPDHWELLHRNGVVVSTALTEWFERVQEYMPTVEYYEVPDPITMGEPFTISGAGYHEGDRVELSIKFSDEHVMPLGEVPLDHGAFHWEGEIPETAHPGLANITMRGFEGTEVVAGITRSSVTVISDVDVVYASRERQPRSLRPGDYNPLWGDLDADVSVIEQLLKAIAMGTVGPVRAEEGIAFSDRGLAVNVRFRDGTIWSVKQVIKCNLTPEGRMTNCVSVPDQYHWNLLHPNQIAFSRLMTDRALTEWFERVEEYMPKVEDYEVPDPITLGEPFAISGAGYHEGERVELSIKFSDESVMPLGELPLDHGAFRWEGEIPETAPSGLTNFSMQVLEGSEVVWGITHESITVTAPSAAGAATELPDDATWVLDLLDGRPLIEETFISLELHGDRLWGLDGCNSFASQPGDGTIIAQADGSFSTPKEILRTLRGCKDLLSDQADAYMAALREAEKFRAVDDRLEVFDSAGATRLVFLRQQPLPGHPVELVGTEWRLLPEGDGEDMGAVTLAFLNDRLVAGTTACRDYVAAYRRLQGKLDFASSSRIGSRQLCSEDSRGSEAAFIHTLSPTEEYSVVESEETRRLIVRTSVGKILVFEPLPPAAEEIVDAEWSLRAFVPLYFVHQHPDGSDVWDLRDMADVLPGTEVTISFDEDGMGGSSGCNSYAGPVRLEDGSITVDSLIHTEKLCAFLAGLMAQEERYLDLLPRLTRYDTYSDGLLIQTDDDVFLLFQAK